MTRLANKVAIITGGAGGIGLATAKRFVAEGAQVLLVDLSEDALKHAVDQIGSEAVSYAVADVTQPEEVERYVQSAVERYGGVDILFNNAGIEGDVKPITDYPIDTFDQVMAVNVRGVWLGLVHTIPHIERRGGGSIIITSSVAGIKGTPTVAPYVTSKHAVIGMMRSAALECASMKIRVNTINPSPVEGRMMEALESGFGAGSEDQFAQGIPLGRYASQNEIAELVLFLASDESSFLTGGVYMVDGGMSAM